MMVVELRASSAAGTRSWEIPQGLFEMHFEVKAVPHSTKGRFRKREVFYWDTEDPNQSVRFDGKELGAADIFSEFEKLLSATVTIDPRRPRGPP